MTRAPQRMRIGSCIDCLAWGPLRWNPRCAACWGFNRNHADTRQQCGACRRILHCSKGFCRLCWTEASRRARPGHGDSLIPILGTLDGHQLFFADMLRALRYRLPAEHRPQKRLRRTLTPPKAFEPAEGLGQYRLFETRRDLAKFERPPFSEWFEEALRQPHIARAMRTADRVAGAYGWSSRLRYDVGRGLIVALACRPPDELVPHSELGALTTHLRISVTRLAAVLDEAGLLLDDRVDTIEINWQRRLADVDPAIRRDALDWLARLRNGSPRSKPRKAGTASEYCRVVAPILRQWSADHDHLREITSHDVLSAVESLPASARSQALVVLRSLFKFLKREKRIFVNPTAQLRPGRVELSVLLPIDEDAYRGAVAAATTPQHRIALVLAAVHAARPADIRVIRLDDIDIGARRITIGGHTRRVEELTHRTLLTYLDFRRQTWPNTANPHLLVTGQTANDTRPVSDYTIIQLFAGLSATLDRLRVDRQLEEALNRGPDPLHLAAVFGISHHTAIRYSEAARQILYADHAPAST